MSSLQKYSIHDFFFSLLLFLKYYITSCASICTKRAQASDCAFLRYFLLIHLFCPLHSSPFLYSSINTNPNSLPHGPHPSTYVPIIEHPTEHKIYSFSIDEFTLRCPAMHLTGTNASFRQKGRFHSFHHDCRNNVRRNGQLGLFNNQTWL